MVEGGRIDHGHHEGNARRALTDMQALDEAIGAAARTVDLSDTLIIVSADHRHVFNIAGYPLRPLQELPYRVNSYEPGYAQSAQHGHGIFDVVYDLDQATGHVSENTDTNGVPYTVLGYLDGPATAASPAWIPGPTRHRAAPGNPERSVAPGVLPGISGSAGIGNTLGRGRRHLRGWARRRTGPWNREEHAHLHRDERSTRYQVVLRSNREFGAQPPDSPSSRTHPMRNVIATKLRIVWCSQACRPADCWPLYHRPPPNSSRRPVV